MGCRAGNGDCPDCFVPDCLLLGGIFGTRVLSACLGFAACFHLHDGSLSSMRAGLVAQDSRVRHRPDLDSIYQRGRDGFICLPPMPFGYWSWTKMSRREGHTRLGRSVSLSITLWLLRLDYAKPLVSLGYEAIHVRAGCLQVSPRSSQRFVGLDCLGLLWPLVV